MERQSHCYRASWNGAVLAESDDVVLLEGNVYFPPESLSGEHLLPARSRSLCIWKGLARYHDVVVDGTTNPGAAWTYQHPSPLARRIKGRVAFWQGVDVRSIS
jgi:uncharacterized protein (DUF427 family)